MKGPVGLGVLTVVPGILLFSALPSLAIQHKYIEEFTTTQFKDAVNTTAWWDIVAGELKLYPFEYTLVGTYDTPGDAYDVAVSGNYAFVANDAFGLHVIDISNPANPGLVGAYNTSGSSYGVAVYGDYAFVADGTTGLQVIDISNPGSPTLVGSYNTPGSAQDVVIFEGYAYVADLGSGLQVIDVSNPASPTRTGSYDTPGLSWGVTVSGGCAYVADYASGLQVIDVSNPASPALLGTCDTPGNAQGVSVVEDYAYVADYTSGLQVIQMFQNDVDSERNIGQSLAVDGSTDMIFRSRLVTTQTNSVTWELSANGGVNWQAVAADGTWNLFAIPGSDLLWRSTHTWAAHGVNPGVTHVEIDWLYESASIDSIVDVPDDQGGWVRAHLTRSSRDFPDGATFPISNYGIWQRVDNPALIAALSAMSTSEPDESVAGEVPSLIPLPVITHQGRVYIQSRPGLAASSFPTGIWEWVASVPALQQDAYIARVPTAADSSGAGTNYAVFVTTTHTTTPSIWYVSGPDSGYSLDNIAPGVPTGFTVAHNTGSGNVLAWDESEDDDFQYFRVYRSTDPDFVPSPSNLVHSTTETSWNDPEYDGWSVYYKITALDYVGNESDPASAGTVTAATGPVVPQTWGLHPNVPNPFNPTTTIRYDVPAGGGEVTLRIYDVSGKLIRTLVDEPQTAGEKTVTWNGRDTQGRGVASGVYFYRLQAPGYEKTLKMTLIQ